MYKEFRDTTLIGAVNNLYADMAGRHRARDRSIQIIRTAVIPDSETRRAHNHLYQVFCPFATLCASTLISSSLFLTVSIVLLIRSMLISSCLFIALY